MNILLVSIVVSKADKVWHMTFIIKGKVFTEVVSPELGQTIVSETSYTKYEDNETEEIYYYSFVG